LSEGRATVAKPAALSCWVWSLRLFPALPAFFVAGVARHRRGFGFRAHRACAALLALSLRSFAVIPTALA
jgi:hypothetical protein